MVPAWPTFWTPDITSTQIPLESHSMTAQWYRQNEQPRKLCLPSATRKARTVQRGHSPASSPCMNEAHIKVWLHVESRVKPTAASFWSHRLEQLLSWCRKHQVPSSLPPSLTPPRCYPGTGGQLPPPQPPCFPPLICCAGYLLVE
ncbi:hypothetical protein LY76DRAFT_5028 [Colletotrichum caudatum]|nr:hypothetical protein LY76DRAFT_5028 [Colletotrichum caudatum]